MDDPTRRRRHAAGYTIIELMLALIILAVLAAISIGAYQDYTQRTRMLEVMLAATTCKVRVFEAYYVGHRPSPGNWGCERGPATEGLVQSVLVDPNGKISVIARGFGNAAIDGEALTLAPFAGGVPANIELHRGDQLDWRCGSPADGTSIPPEFLPSSCRGN